MSSLLTRSQLSKICSRRSSHLKDTLKGNLKDLKKLVQKDEAADIADKDQFLLAMDVKRFTPDELSVRLSTEHAITVQGVHEKKDDKGVTSQFFAVTHYLPKGYDMKKIESKLSSDGILTIAAPKSVNDGAADGNRKITIEQTGKPYKL